MLFATLIRGYIFWKEIRIFLFQPHRLMVGDIIGFMNIYEQSNWIEVCFDLSLSTYSTLSTEGKLLKGMF